MAQHSNQNNSVSLETTKPNRTEPVYLQPAASQDVRLIHHRRTKRHPAARSVSQPILRSFLSTEARSLQSPCRCCLATTSSSTTSSCYYILLLFTLPVETSCSTQPRHSKVFSSIR
ncbi:hypothetical protein CHARACLAT_031726 [Characodon lateralis]|uniref:Uncharacterized protein n=1 Tax=Characodon lateralis TaxID=208331 RepID=A0ABU7EP33_9TELE|nr:hypothetical protein [Characodon lateralis]